ncbi:hypothetical protein [Natronorubrum sp. FCH18a]|uniref:hypothetical protein n=1 Tax=Natronorubrum sp. FCH18a TaxID=3447018 RepID=UPI003F51AC4C
MNVNTEDESMRVCVLFDGETISEWVARAIERMLDETDAEITLLVINDEPDRTPGELLKRSVESPHWARITGGQLLIDRLLGEPGYRKPRPIDEIDGLERVPRVYCTPTPTDGFGNELPDDVVKMVGANADIVFREGFNVIKGEILTVTEHGVVSFHHGDPTAYRGGPAGFWEFLDGADTAGILLQQLTETLDAGQIVVYDEVDTSDAPTWREVQRRQYVHSVPFLAAAIERFEDESFEPERLESLGPVHTAPNAVDYVRYQYKNTLGKIRTLVSDVTDHAPVATVRTPAEER